jgi:hypothetical protein
MGWDVKQGFQMEYSMVCFNQNIFLQFMSYKIFHLEILLGIDHVLIGGGSEKGTNFFFCR